MNQIQVSEASHLRPAQVASWLCGGIRVRDETAHNHVGQLGEVARVAENSAQIIELPIVSHLLSTVLMSTHAAVDAVCVVKRRPMLNHQI